jgi:hypothetical protein
MTYQGALVYPSTNSKTGPIAVITITEETCAEDCPFRDGPCYARSGPLRLHWLAVTRKERGEPWEALCGSVSRLPLKIMIRYGQAGDLPGDGVIIDHLALFKIAAAAQGRKMFGYTHYDMSLEWNASCVEKAIADGFVINVSGNSLEHADELKLLTTAPVVCVVPRDYPHTGGRTPDGHRVVVCPAQTHEGVNCISCKLCASAKRKSIIGFLAHGSRARQAEVVALGGAAA